jgi:hypothetical protein
MKNGNARAETLASGLMLPMIAGSLPDVVPVFTQYAADLKRAAESAA